MKHLVVLIWLVALTLDAAPRPRLVVLTDIGGDPDDQQSLVRLLVFANEFELEGLIASASGTPGELQEAVTRPELIRELIGAYANVHPNLTNHAAGFPDPAQLLSVVRTGNPRRGRAAIGEGFDTEASRLLIELADRDDDRPLNLAIWGGQTDLAQACWTVREERGAAGLRKFVQRLRIYDIADQDDILEWMHGEFQFPFYLLNKSRPGFDRREAAFRGMYLGGDESLTSREWIELNVRTGHGPLGALYPHRTWTAPNPHSALKEGDTPSWFYFLPHGVNDPNFPNWGGWGGRFQMHTNGVWIDAHDLVDGLSNARTTVSRWRAEFQAHFQARMDWCVKPVRDANHPPRAAVNGDLGDAIVRQTVGPGEIIRLDPGQSIDPDGQTLRHHWWQYGEAGSWPGELKLEADRAGVLRVSIPADAKGRTIHLILNTTDAGEPPLTVHRRVILDVTR